MTDQTLVALLAEAADEIGAVHKDSTNTQQGFKFRGVDAVVNACAPALHRRGIIVTPIVEDSEFTQVEVGSKRTLMAHVRLRVRYIFRRGAETVETVVVSEAMDSGDKAASKAMSVAFRTALLQTLSLPTDEPDPDSETFQRSEPAPKQRPAAASSPELDELRALWTQGRSTDVLAAVAEAATEAGIRAPKTPADLATYNRAVLTRALAILAGYAPFEGPDDLA